MIRGKQVRSLHMWWRKLAEPKGENEISLSNGVVVNKAKTDVKSFQIVNNLLVI